MISFLKLLNWVKSMKVLLSIKPSYVDKIRTGRKKFEFRKIIFKNVPDSIIVYETMPVGKVVGEIFLIEYSGIHQKKFGKRRKHMQELAKSVFISTLAQKKLLML